MFNDGVFDKVGQVEAICDHKGKHIDVDVVNYTLDDARAIWKIIAARRTWVEVCDLEDGTLYRCQIYGTEKLWYGDGTSYFSLQIISESAEERPPTSA